MLSRLILVFLFVVQTNSLSVLTDDKSQTTKTDGETVLVRQLLNQETLIRMALDRKVNDLVKVIGEIQNSLGTNNKQLQDAKTEIETNNNQLQDAKRAIETNNQQLQYARRAIETYHKQLQDATTEIAALKNENSALKAEWQVQTNITTFLSDNLKTTINTVKQSQNSQRELLTAVSSLQAVQKNISSQLSESTVGFTVGVTSIDSTWAGDILVFPHVVSNTGHYNTQTGKFMAPRDGTYVFFVVVVSDTNNDLRLDIVHDGNSKVRTDLHSSDHYRTASNLAVLKLDKGDFVWVKRSAGKGYHSTNIPYVTFSGFLL